MKIAIVGTGYVGLVTGACLAEAGHEVVCIDNNEQKVVAMRQGISPIYEVGLSDIMQSTIAEGRLSFTTDLAKGVAQAEAIFLALPTPPQDDGSADLSAVLSVAGQLADCMPKHYTVVINKSTVPVGTAKAVRKVIAGTSSAQFDVVSNPEFLREGRAVSDFMEPERVVVGVTSARAEAKMREVYESIVDDEHPIYVTDPVTAELIKYAANTFLFTKIGFMNEIAQLCERLGADVEYVRLGIGADSRIGHKFLYPGIGAGGSCFPKDVRALQYMARQSNYDFKLLSAAMRVNEQQQNTLVSKIKDHFDGNIAGKTFALWGLAFKPETDDIRESPALVLVQSLLEAGARVVAYDPEAGENVKSLYKNEKNLTVVDEKYQALQDAEALVIATEWDEFVTSDLSKIGKALKQKLVFDGRNIFHPGEMKKNNFSYYSIGRRPIVQ